MRGRDGDAAGRLKQLGATGGGAHDLDLRVRRDDGVTDEVQDDTMGVDAFVPQFSVSLINGCVSGGVKRCWAVSGEG